MTSIADDMASGIIICEKCGLKTQGICDASTSKFVGHSV